MAALLLLLATSLASPAHADELAPQWVKGRVLSYQGVYPLHVAALASRDLSNPSNPLGWATVDPETGTFDISLPHNVEAVYLLGQLDRERAGPRLNGSFLFFFRKLPYAIAPLQGKRLVLDVAGMELADLVRERNTSSAPWIAFGLAVLLYGLGFLAHRRLSASPRPEPPRIPAGGWALGGVALLTTLPLLVGLGSEALELLEFTYLHEGLRPDSIGQLLFDPISAELSHPPLWPLVLRLFAGVSTAEWWLRLPSVAAHLGFVIVTYRLTAGAAGRRTGLLAAAVAGLLPVAFYYGRDATPYALLGLVSAGATLAAVRERWTLFALTLTAGFFVHYTVGVLGATLAIGLVWGCWSERDSGRLRRALIAYGAVCALPLFWSVHFIRTFLASGLSTRLMSGDYLPDPGFLSYVGHFGAVVLGVPPGLGWLVPPALLLAGWGAVVLLRTHPLLGRLLCVQLVMVVGYVLFAWVMYMRFARGRVFYAYRWTSVFLPAVAACQAMAIRDLWTRKKALGSAVGAALLLGSLVQDARVLLTPQRPDQWQAASRVQDERLPGDAFCALPAVYYGQLFNYALFDRRPKDLLAWPGWSDGLYGPFHDRNTTIETLSTSLAFGRIWVAVFDERMFGTRKFSPHTSEHTLEWMKEHLVPDGEWSYPHLRLYRFKVPPRPEEIWNDRKLTLNFSKTIRNFRYFPSWPHTQYVGKSMSAEEVAVRLPTPDEGAFRLTLRLEVIAREPLRAADLTVDGVELTFEATDDGGIWKAELRGRGPLLDLVLRRTPGAAAAHRNTLVHLEYLPDGS